MSKVISIARRVPGLRFLANLLNLSPRRMSAHDSELISSLISDAPSGEREFRYGLKRLLVKCLYCHAPPGTLETTLTLISQLTPNGNCLNVGGGPGAVSDLIRRLNIDVWNLDLVVDEPSPRNIAFNLNSNEEIPVEEEKFDIVLCQEVIEHVENPWELFRKISRVLKADGHLIITTPNIVSRYSRIKFLITGYFHWFTPDCFSYHINPVAWWEITNISRMNGFIQQGFYGSGDYYFSPGRSERVMLARNEGIIFLFRKVS